MAADAGATGTAAAVRRVVLAHEPAVRLGPLTIAPALRQIIHADGRDEIVEPKVMEVLVVLLRARGRILTRDELCAAAWDGRIVGDDAINRALSRLRRLGEGIGAGVFAVETITKAGYRLVATVPAEPAADDRPAGSTIAEPSLPPVPPEHEIASCLLRDNLGESLRQSGLELVIATRRRCST
jgi:DNA-binding winged helix-turn-helix (wHTH) protein